jgi:hypothetical protein
MLPFTNDQIYWNNDTKQLTINLFSKNMSSINETLLNECRDMTKGLYIPHIMAVSLRLLDRGKYNNSYLNAVQKIGNAALVVLDANNFSKSGHKYCFSPEESVLKYNQEDIPSRDEWIQYWDTYLSPDKINSYRV